MHVRISWQNLGIGLSWLMIGGLWGCSDSQSSGSRPVVSVAQPQAANTTAINQLPTQIVTFDVCGEVTNWQRLERAEQIAALRENPRYGDALLEEPLQSLFETFWHESVITFTTYGLSARTEPIFLSGVWTGIDAMEGCYSGEQTTAINAGEMAELWLIGHRVSSIVWTGEHYRIEVISAETGLQFVQFNRVEKNEALPIFVVEDSGQEITFASGDW